MSETRSRDVSLGGPEWSRGTSAADAGEGVASEGAVRKRDAETMARLDADVRALLFSGWAPSAIRLELGCGTERINLALSRMDDADRARREAATSTRSRSRSADAGVRDTDADGRADLRPSRLQRRPRRGGAAAHGVGPVGL